MTEKQSDNEITCNFEAIGEDIPFEVTSSDNTETAIMPREVANEYERKFWETKKHWELKDHAFYLMIACIVLFVLLYIGDVILINLKLDNSIMLGDVADFIKSIVSILIGFLFAQATKDK